MFDLTFATFTITEGAEYTCLRSGRRVRVLFFAIDTTSGQEKVCIMAGKCRLLLTPAAFSCRYVPVPVEEAGLAALAADPVPARAAGFVGKGSGA